MPTSSRRDVLKSLAGGAVAAATLARCGGGEPEFSGPRPNILFVMTDDQQHDQMSCAGHPILKTPNIDRIAEGGVRFANAFCTNSLCAPGRATALTGVLSHVHGIRGNSEKADQIEELDPTLPTFPQMLQEAGYKTALMGKWHIRHDPRGFDDWKILPGQGVYQDPVYLHRGEERKETGYEVDVTADFALDFLRKSSGGDAPWCLVFQTKAPHRPFQPAPRHADLFSDIEWPKPPTYDDDYATRQVAAEAEDMRFEVSLAGDYQGEIPGGLSASAKRDWIFNRFVKDHHRAVYSVDENLGRILDYLDQSGQAEDTLIVYTTDNGFFLGEHGWYDKRFMYEPALRIPLLMRYPRRIDPGKVETGFIMNIDLAPTILDYAGITPPESMQGRSALPLIEGAAEDWREEVYYSYYENSWAFRDMDREQMTDPSFQFWTAHRVGPNRGIRTDRYKLIEYYTEGDGYWELFDLENDPNELVNLADDPGHAALRGELTQRLRQVQASYGDEG